MAAFGLAGALVLPLAAPPPAASQTAFGGDLRVFAFRIVDDVEADDGEGGLSSGVELGLLRLKLESRWRSADGDRLRFEWHGVAEAVSPRGSGALTSIATGGTRRFFDLESDAFDSADTVGSTGIDRLNLRWDRPGFRLTFGRQAISLGVNYFWPVLDLFAPFPPQRIDRDYKPGVDAVRVTVPLGDFSEVEVIAAALGDRTPDDLSLASFGRFHRELGESASIDFGYLVGSVHRDLVLGGFFAADVCGTGLRGELAWTRPVCDDAVALPRFACGGFWRATVGVDRLLGPRLTLVAEAGWNGFGVGDPAEYALLADADRVRRGEVVSPGRWYAGLSLAWQAHPLVAVSGAVLTNRDDGSTLFQPGLTWSMSDRISLVAGVVVGGGRGALRGELRSEYGDVPLVAWSSLVAWF